MKLTHHLTALIAAAALSVASMGALACGGGSKANTIPDNPKPAEATTPDADQPAAAPTEVQPATSGTTLTDQELEQAFQLVQSLGKAAAANKGNCEATATAIDQIVTDEQALIEKMNSVSEAQDDELEKRFEAKYGDAPQKTLAAMFTDLQPCLDDPAVQAALEKLNEGGPEDAEEMEKSEAPSAPGEEG